MKTLTLSRNGIFPLLVVWWAIFADLFLTGSNPFQLLNILGFAFLMIVPGFLTVILLRIAELEFWAHVGIVVGLSILELMCIVLLGNTVLPYFGITRPLSPLVVFAEMSALVAVLGAFSFQKTSAHTIVLNKFIFGSFREFALAFSPAIFIGLSIMGAARLNNGAGNGVTVLMLVAIGIHMAVLLYETIRKDRLHPAVIPTAIFGNALALLLMTSLRGWFTTGHDIQTEFYVFELAKTNGAWAVALFRNAYNACLSITILPTIFSGLLQMPDVYVYKVPFQIIFACMPPLAYLIVRRYASQTIALLSVFYLISFPTFFSDMTMLNRQEVAFLFLALMIYVLFESRMAVSLRRLLFAIFGIGMIVSHYSTTYTVIALLAFLLIMRPLASRIIARMRRFPIFLRSAVIPSAYPSDQGDAPAMNVTIFVVLCAATFLWSSVLTDTSSGNVTRVFVKTVEAMRGATKDDARSADVLYSIFSWRTPNPAESLAAYQRAVVAPARAAAPAGTYYDDAVKNEYSVQVASATVGPLTRFGSIASRGFPVSSVPYLIRQFFAKVLQALIIIGLGFAMFRRDHTVKTVDVDFSLLAVGSLFLIASQMFLPVLSAEYGIFRAFQQSLIFLSVFITFGSIALLGFFKEPARLTIASLVAVLFFYSMSGIITQLFIQRPPQLHLSNSGSYYDYYYTTRNDLFVADWLRTSRPGGGMLIQSDMADRNALRSIPGASVSAGIYPGLIKKDSYVVLDETNIGRQNSTILWNADLVVYKYPISFLDDQKDLIYSNGSASVYR